MRPVGAQARQHRAKITATLPEDGIEHTVGLTMTCRAVRPTAVCRSPDSLITRLAARQHDDTRPVGRRARSTRAIGAWLHLARSAVALPMRERGHIPGGPRGAALAQRTQVNELSARTPPSFVLFPASVRGSQPAMPTTSGRTGR
ncbi:hypothetical protein MTO96_011852 [Rhipicephalus appendiculatus]